MDIYLIRPQSVGPMRRVGSRNDGGYVIPQNLPKFNTCITFGLGDDWSFERELLKKGCINNFISYDHTVSLKSLIHRTTRRLKLRNFSLHALAYRVLILCRYFRDFKAKKYVHVMKEITELENTDEKTNLLEVAKDLIDSQFMLKVDIEGGEYNLIYQILELSARIPLLIIEFHDTEFMRNKFEDSITKLLKHYVICHTHANNFESLSGDGIPIAVEITFGRRDVYKGEREIDSLPIFALDAPSAPKRKDHAISFTRTPNP